MQLIVRIDHTVRIFPPESTIDGRWVAKAILTKTGSEHTFAVLGPPCATPEAAADEALALVRRQALVASD